MTEKIISNGYKYRWDQSNLNNTNWNIKHLICCTVMTYNTQYPDTVSEQLNEDNKKKFKYLPLVVFLSTPGSRTSYHAWTYWLLYQINFVTWVPVKFQQKTNLALNNWLDPQISLTSSVCTRYDKFSLYFVYNYFLCWK